MMLKTSLVVLSVAQGALGQAVVSNIFALTNFYSDTMCTQPSGQYAVSAQQVFRSKRVNGVTTMVRSDLNGVVLLGDGAITSCYDTSGTDYAGSTASQRYQFVSMGQGINDPQQGYNVYGFPSLQECTSFRSNFQTGSIETLARVLATETSKISSGNYPSDCTELFGKYSRVIRLVFNQASVPWLTYPLWTAPPSPPPAAGSSAGDVYVGVKKYDNSYCYGDGDKAAIKLDEYMGMAGINGVTSAVRGDLAGMLVGEGAITSCYDASGLPDVPNSARYQFYAVGQTVTDAGQGYSAYGFSSLDACNARRNIFSSGTVAQIAEVTANPSDPSKIDDGQYPTDCFTWGSNYYFKVDGVKFRRADVPSDYPFWTPPAGPAPKAWGWGWGWGWGWIISSWWPSFQWGWGNGWGFTWGQH